MCEVTAQREEGAALGVFAVCAEDKNRDSVRNNAPNDTPNQSALAGPIGAKQAQALSVLYPKRDAVNRSYPAEALDEAIHLERPWLGISARLSHSYKLHRGP
jgi:hypothetical protein